MNQGKQQGYAESADERSLARALRDTLELQSASARFFGDLARQASNPDTRKLLFDFARVEQLLVLQVDSMAEQFSATPLPPRCDPRIPGIKTAPEWSSVPSLSVEQAIAVALDCTRRAFHHHTAMAMKFDGPAGDVFLTLAQADEDRARMFESALDRRLAELAASHPVDRVIVETLDAVRKAGKAYSRMAKRTSRAQTRQFLEGMVEVCALHAASIQTLVREPRELETDSLFEGLVSATCPSLECSIDDLEFASAMRMAMSAQKRAALVHGMLARAFPGEESQRLLDIADAERRHAATIASVLDRLTPEADEFESPLAHAPRQSWTCPAVPVEEEPVPPSLRLVAS
jgi:rubrerythrin